MSARFAPHHGGNPACEGGEGRHGQPKGLSPKPQLSSCGTGFTLREVTKTYRAGTPHEVRALQSVTVEGYPGEITVVYGPSGSGKTTLISLIGALDRPTSGTIHLNGEEITQFAEPALARLRRTQIGFVFQNFNLLPGVPAWENVSQPLIPRGMGDHARRERARELLERFHLGHRLLHPPEELSGGEQQRVAIARALVGNPGILIADEPTSNIDEEEIGRLLACFTELKGKGTTLFISTHDPILRGLADVVWHLKGGWLIEVERRPPASRPDAPAGSAAP